MSKKPNQWEENYQNRQEQINSCARCFFQPRLRTVDKILVPHPQEYRRYLQRHPCDGCRAERFCDVPCAVYLKWYNARMESAKIRGGLKGYRYVISPD